jgi:hypothetical protein
MKDELETMVRESDEKSLSGRIERLRFLNDNLGEGYSPFPAIVLEYFEETKLCFFYGAYVSTIIMASATFEELFRQLYREANKMEKANAKGLASLVERAIEDGLISTEEAEKLTELRQLRNRFTHINIGFGKGSIENKHTLLDYTLLWGDPREETLPIEDLSKNAIIIFARLLPKLCSRFWGPK